MTVKKKPLGSPAWTINTNIGSKPSLYIGKLAKLLTVASLALTIIAIVNGRKPNLDYYTIFNVGQPILGNVGIIDIDNKSKPGLDN